MYASFLAYDPGRRISKNVAKMIPLNSLLWSVEKKKKKETVDSSELWVSVRAATQTLFIESVKVMAGSCLEYSNKT